MRNTWTKWSRIKFYGLSYFLKEGDVMPWWGLALIAVFVVSSVIDWIVIMGCNPHRWKGSKGN